MYNPQGYAFDSTNYNQIQFTYDGGKSYAKYPLEIMNYCNKSGYEGLFYKFKVTLTDSQRTSILLTLDSSSRVYTVSGIELAVNGTITEYAVGATYIYTGYSLGYGSSAATESTLTCTVDGFDRYLNLDVTHTTYRPNGDYYNGEQSQLDSVFFTIPNEYLELYGELTNVACEWYEYITQPMLVTEDASFYNAVNGLYGRTMSNLSSSYYYMFGMHGITNSTFFKKSASARIASNLEYEDGASYSWGLGNSATIDLDLWFYNFAGAFYTSGESYDSYSVSSEDILAKLQSYSKRLGDTSVCGKYAAALFDSDYTGAGYSGVVDVNVSDVQVLYSNYVTKSWWQKMFGGYDVSTEYDTVQALVSFSENDIESAYAGTHYLFSDLDGLDDAAISELYLIGEGDVESFKTACSEAKANDETVVLMRFASSTYYSAPCTQAMCSSSVSDPHLTLVKDTSTQWGDGDYSAYVFQETVYLNFDIISLTFTSDGQETVIPVVMSPIDLAGGSTPPLEEDYGTSGTSIFMIIVALLLLLLLVIILFPVLPYIVKGVVWVVALPFKGIGAVFRTASKKKDKEPEEKKSKVKKRQEDTPYSEYSREEIEAYLDEIYGDDDF
ncbi:MAG: hypothetical protein LUI60_08075 [Clostridia bacterium]|nr:hypothetical protein [Clostridia bacterium]